MPRTVTHKGEDIEYVEVYDDPLHLREFDNEYVWIYRARIQPGQMSSWHRHAQDTFYVALASSEALNFPCLKDEYLHKPKVFDMWWHECKETPMIHKVGVPATCQHDAKFLGVEMLSPPSVFSDLPLQNDFYVLNETVSRKNARIYEMKIEPGQSTGLHIWNFHCVVICLSDGNLSSENVNSPFSSDHLEKFGNFQFFNGPLEFSVTNVGETVYKAIVIELLKY